MERAGVKDCGTLSQWRGRKIISEMIKAKVMLKLQVVDVQPAGDRDEGRGTTKTSLGLISINPTASLPYFLIVTIVATHKS